MLRRLALIFLSLAILWTYVQAFNPRQDWERLLSPWLGQDVHVSKYLDMRTMDLFRIKVNDAQVHAWKDMFEAAQIPYKSEGNQLETEEPFVLKYSSGEELAIKNIILRDDLDKDGVQELMIHFGLQTEARILPMQYPELDARAEGVSAGKLLALVIISGGCASLIFLINSHRGKSCRWGFERGLNLTTGLVVMLSVASSIGLSWWSRSVFYNIDTMIILIFVFGLNNSITWSLLWGIDRLIHLSQGDVKNARELTRAFLKRLF